MSKIEKYLGIANHDIQVANNSNELKSYVASILCEIDELQQENKQLKEVINKAIEFSNKNWGTWCSNHLEYMTELQNILKEVE